MAASAASATTPVQKRNRGFIAPSLERAVAGVAAHNSSSDIVHWRPGCADSQIAADLVIIEVHLAFAYRVGRGNLIGVGESLRTFRPERLRHTVIPISVAEGVGLIIVPPSRMK